MAKSMSMKWVLVIVVCLALFAYQRQNAKKKAPFGETVDLQIEETNPQTDDVYTSVPAMDVNNNEMADIEDEFDLGETADESIANMNIPFMDEVRTTNEFFDSDEPGLQPELTDEHNSTTKLPHIDDHQPVNNGADHAGYNPSQPLQLPQGVMMKIVRHIEYGKSLARRGAVFGAKNEFHNALRLVAQSMDYQFDTKEFSESLYRALEAINEADDFYFAQSRNNGRVDVAAIGNRHTSKILSEQELKEINSVDAMQAYYNFVQDQLVKCSGRTVVAGEALYCLGKLYLVKRKMSVDGSPLDSAKSIVHHRAAIGCDKRNFKSANELAVLLFNSGRPEQAKKLLLQSLKIRQVPAAWENLAKVHQQLGEHQLAQLARTEFQRMMGNSPTTNKIQWISPSEFAEGSSREPAELRVANAAGQGNASQEPKQSKIKNIFTKLF